MTSILPILIGTVLAGWAFLTLLGGERTRRVNHLEAMIAAKAAAVPPPKDAPVPMAKAIPSTAAKSPAPATAKPAAPAKAEAKPKADAKGGKGKGGK